MVSSARYENAGWIITVLHPQGRPPQMGWGVGTYTGRLRFLASRPVCGDMKASHLATVHELLGNAPGGPVVAGTLDEDPFSLPDTFDTMHSLSIADLIGDNGHAVRQLARWLAPGYSRRNAARAVQRLAGELDLIPLSPPCYLYALGVAGRRWSGRLPGRAQVPGHRIAKSNPLVKLLHRPVGGLSSASRLIAMARAAHRRANG